MSEAMKLFSAIVGHLSFACGVYYWWRDKPDRAAACFAMCAAIRVAAL